MARRRRRRRPGGHTTAVGSGGRRAPISTDTASHTHTARSLACPLLTLSSARPFSNGIFRSHGAPASLPPASSSLTHARRMDGFCNQNADQLGYLAGPSRLTVYVGVVECASRGTYPIGAAHFCDPSCCPCDFWTSISMTLVTTVAVFEDVGRSSRWASAAASLLTFSCAGCVGSTTPLIRSSR